MPTTALLTVTASDPSREGADNGRDITYTLTGHADFAIDGDGAITYTGTGFDYETVQAADGWDVNGTDPTLTLSVTATSDGEQETADVTITLVDANDAPVVVSGADLPDIKRGDTATLTVSDLFTDPEWRHADAGAGSGLPTSSKPTLHRSRWCLHTDCRF